MVNGWKVTAIIFICLFLGVVAFNVWAYTSVVEEEKAMNNCYYNTCSEYPDAWYDSGLCTCYDDDYNVAKTTYEK